jgi:hypothetical protein
MIFGEDWEKNRRESIAQAKRAPKGMEAIQLVPGAIVTMGPCKHTGDRSYIDVIWEVVACNGGHVALKRLHGTTFTDDVKIIVVSEHEWYPAEGLFDAVRAAGKTAE